MNIESWRNGFGRVSVGGEREGADGGGLGGECGWERQCSMLDGWVGKSNGRYSQTV